MKINRRQFLNVTTAFVMSLPSISLTAEGSQEESKYEMLVLGDSVVWGQGLNKNDKFYMLVANEIRKRTGREINIEVKAHSNATILPKDKICLKHKSCLEDEDGEIPITTPTLYGQLEKAVSTYSCKAQITAKNKVGEPTYKCPEVNLILLNGGINDIGVSTMINPFTNKSYIIRKSQRYCGKEMEKFLVKLLDTFENALIVVTGYYPIISKETDLSLSNGLLLESLGLEGQNVLSKAAKKKNSANWLLERMAKRSMLWKTSSDKALQSAVDAANKSRASSRAMFVKVDFAPEECYGAPRTALFKLKFDQNNLVSNDDMFSVRSKLCPDTVRRMNAVKMDPLQKLFTERICPVAGIGHPNKYGARKYSEAIIRALPGSLLIDTYAANGHKKTVL